MEKETHKSKVESRNQFYKRSHFSASTKRSNKNCTGTTQPIHINTVCGETNLKEKTNFQLKEFERCVQPCKFKMEGLDTVRKLIQLGDFMMKLDLQDASIRAFQCTLDIHQTIETSHFTAAIAGDTNCNISGRYAHFGLESRHTGLGVSQHCVCAKTTGLSYQAGKMLPSSNTTHRISRLPDQLHRHAAVSSTEREAPKHSGRMQEGIRIVFCR